MTAKTIAVKNSRNATSAAENIIGKMARPQFIHKKLEYLIIVLSCGHGYYMYYCPCSDGQKIYKCTTT